MRTLSLLLIAAAVAGCTTAPEPPAFRSAENQMQLNRLLAGKAAGQPVSCLPSYRADNMVVIDDDTIAFRDTGSRVYIADFRGHSCSRLSSGHYALVTKSFGGGLCRGDIAQVMDVSNGTTVGTCVFGDFTPYVRPGA